MEPPANPGDAIKKGKGALKSLPRWAWILVIGGSVLVGYVIIRQRNAAASAVASDADATTAIPVAQTYDPTAQSLYGGSSEPLSNFYPPSYAGNIFSGSPVQQSPSIGDASGNTTVAPAPAAPQPIVIVAPQPVNPNPVQTIAQPTGGGPPAPVDAGTTHTNSALKNSLQNQVKALNAQADKVGSGATPAQRQQWAAQYRVLKWQLVAMGASLPAPSGKYAKYV